MVTDVSSLDLEYKDESYLNGPDYWLFRISATLGRVFSSARLMAGRLVAPIDPKKFDNASTKTREIFFRVLIVLGATLSFCFAGMYLLASAAFLSKGAKIFRSLGFYFQKDHFTLLRGEAKEETNLQDDIKVLNWNIRGLKEVLHYKKAGLVHWPSRLPHICDQIKKESPHIVVLEEISDPSLPFEIHRLLKEEFAYFYTLLGESGLMVLSKCPLSRFSYENFKDTDKELQRGFFELEIKSDTKDPLFRMIGTQLSPQKDAFEIRKSQVDQMIQHLAKKEKVAPTVLVGSLYMNYDKTDDLSRYLLAHSYLDKDNPTHSGKLASQWAPADESEETPNTVALVEDLDLHARTRKINLVKVKLVPGFELDKEGNPDTSRARSNIHGIYAEITGLSK